MSQYHRFQELVAQGGEAAAENEFHMAVEDAAAIVSETEMAKDAEAYRRLKQRPRMTGFLLQGTPNDGPKMSHAWAVGGARSKTGKPLLESDPQLPLSTPPFFYEFHLNAGPIDARGLGVPGCPGLFIGFNRHIAWGASALGAGSQVVFLEKLTDDGQSYLFESKAEPFMRRLERIRVKDGPEVVQEVLGTRHGVVFNSLSQTNRPGEAHVLHDPQTIQCGTTVRAMLAFMTASNWTEFRAAMEHYYDPGLHIVYADDQNNIGYQTLVHRPLTVRSPRMAQEGWTGQQEIVERIPLDEMPHLFNPEQGFISHANNMSIGTWYPHDLGLGTGGNGHTGRSWRLQQLLTGTHKYGVEDFEALVHRDPVNPVLLALLPIAIKVADEDQVEDAAVKRLIDAVRGWDLRAETQADYPALAQLRNVLTPYRGSGLNDSYGAGMGGVTNLARRLAADFARDGATPRGERERAYLKKWLQASAQGAPGRGRGAGAADDWTARMRQGAPEAAGNTITIPYQGMTPLQLPKVDPSLDIVSPPLTCLDNGTIWSQPGNVYTHIVDLADIDNSRAMIAPGNCEDGTSPLRTAGIDLWVQGRTRPAPLSRDKIEQLGCSTTRVEARSYQGPLAPPAWTVDKPDPAAQFVAAIPAIEPAKEVVEPRPRPAEAQKPDDPRIEAAFRVILRPSGTPNDEVDAQLAEARKYVEGKPELVKQLRGAAVLGIYLIEESAAGRLKVQYGSPYVLERLREVFKELDGGQPPAPSPASKPDSKPSPLTAAEPDLLGYWPLRGDCQDHSGNGLHAVNHGVKLDDGTFDGRGAYLEIPPNRKLQLGAKDFSFSAWVHTDKDVDDVIGDVVSQYDAATRRGVNLTLKSTAGGYSPHGDDRHAYFGIDNAQEPTWEDCGRPSATSNYVSNSLTVFDGHLVLVGEMDIRSQGPAPHRLTLHLCGGDDERSPDHWAEIDLVDLGDKAHFSAMAALPVGLARHEDKFLELPHPADQGFLCRLSLNGTTNLVELAVKVGNAWRPVCPPIELPLRTVHTEIKMHSNHGWPTAQQAAGSSSRAWFDNVRIYPRPESHHVGVRLTRADGQMIWFRENDGWPPKIIDAAGKTRSIEDLEVQLWTADGKTQVAAVRSANMGFYLLPLKDAPWDVYPVAAEIRVVLDGKPLGPPQRIECQGVRGLYPDDVYNVVTADQDDAARASMREKPLAERIAARTYPSVFQAWSPAENVKEPWSWRSLWGGSAERTAARHDLIFSTPEYLGLRWNDRHAGLATGFTPESTERGREYRKRLLELNPHLILLSELRYREGLYSPPGSGVDFWQQGEYPPDSELWLRDQDGHLCPGWGEDADGDGTVERHEIQQMLLDFRNSKLHESIAARALALKETGLFDGIMLDWWNEHDATTGRWPDWQRSVLTRDEELAARLAILRTVRQRVGDDFLILVNANERTVPQSAPYVNGLFMECWKPRHDEGYAPERFDQIAATLLWAEEHLKHPRIDCLEGWRIVSELAGGRTTRIKERDSEANRKWMRLFTTLSLTHSDGYVLFGDDNAQPTPDHLHNWYPFWDKSLGRPAGKGHKADDGSFQREFDQGTAVYNPPGNRPITVSLTYLKREKLHMKTISVVTCRTPANVRPFSVASHP